MKERRGNRGTPETGIPSRNWDTAFLFLVSTAVLFARFLHPATMLGYYEDDFFYYLKVAENIATTGVSTFNGIALTNGYHPLWMIVLVTLRRMLHGTVFFAALEIVALLATMATYLLLRRIFSLFLVDWVARAGSLALGLAVLQLMRYGMEITLTLPLAALLVWALLEGGPPVTPGRACGLGLLASLVILSRLDAGLLVALLCVVSLPLIARCPQPVRVIAAFACGVVPLLAVYFIFDLHVFHLLTPVSGLSKQMKTTWLPSAATWKTLIPDDRMKAILIAPQLLLLAAGLTMLAGIRRKRDYARNVLAALMLFPLLHWSLLSVLSDWPMWPWYFYSLTLACIGAFALLGQGRLQQPMLYAAVGFAALCVLYSAAYVYKGPNSLTVLRTSSGLAQYMDAHPGVWLMGDQAGTTGYLSHQPIVQLEGLVMDRDFLQMMREGTPLREVVEHYHGDYYAVFGELDGNGCLALAEPSNAGATSPRMRGRVCSPPLATFDRGDARIQVFRASDVQ